MGITSAMDATASLRAVGEKVFGALPDGPRIAMRRLLRSQKERRKLKAADFTVIAHPKSGSTWLRFQLARTYQRKFELPESLIPRVERFHDVDPDLPRLHMAGYEYIKHVVARPAPDSEIFDKTVVFMARHPIDIGVSLYFHIQKHALRERKLFNNWPLDLDRTPMIDFLLKSNWGLREAIVFYNACAAHAAVMPRSRIVRYEDMLQAPADTLGTVLAFAGADFSREECEEAAEYTSFDRMRKAEIENTFNSTRLRPGDAKDTDSFKVRRGKAMGYRDYLNPDEIQMLEAMVASELDPIYGYAPSRTHRP